MDTVKSPTIRLLGIDFNNIGLTETVDRLLARPRVARFVYVVTPNADHIDRLRRIPRLRIVYHHAMLCLLDSQMIALCASRLGLRHPQVVIGADLTEALLARLAGMRERVAVIGMRPDAFKALAARYPDITFLHHEPPMGLLHDAVGFAEARDFACATQAAFIFLALGSPVQELLAYAVAARREATGVGLCIGSALDYCAGSARRAPAWMRARGLEWLYRLLQEPGRLAGRYLLSDPRVLVALVTAALRGR